MEGTAAEVSACLCVCVCVFLVPDCRGELTIVIIMAAFIQSTGAQSGSRS